MRRTYAKLNNELARPIGIMDATKPGGANKKPRTTVRATDCKVTRADGTTYVIAARSTNSRTTAPKRHRVIVVAEDRRSELFRAYS